MSECHSRAEQHREAYLGQAVDPSFLEDRTVIMVFSSWVPRSASADGNAGGTLHDDTPLIVLFLLPAMSESSAKVQSNWLR